MSVFKPAYQSALESGELEQKARQAESMLRSCRVCPRNCAVNRLAGKPGKCKVGAEAIVSSAFPHFGEEACLVGNGGSGTIFFGGCNLQCTFCQNYETSHLLEGWETSSEELAEKMLRLQNEGCHNINLVTPSHVVPQIMRALFLAAQNGLKLPLVYNTSAYDALNTLKFLEGLIDIYMPDFKFFKNQSAARFTEVDDYADRAKEAIKEMHRQVGDLQIVNGLAVRGLLLRHLVMPGYVNESREIFRFIATEISPDTYVNIMAQYRPAGREGRRSSIGRRVLQEEYHQAVAAAREAGLWRLED
ncbi:MAG: radical SAM protein [Calditrichia bacterium]